MKTYKVLPYSIAITLFVFASISYFYPVLKGEKIVQSDITQFIGMSKEIVDYRVEKKHEPYWSGAAFSGMPAFQLSAYYPNDFIRYIDKALRFLPRPADYTFLYFLSFFLLLTALRVNWKLAILGAFSFGFSTYLIIIFGAGHNAKAHAIAYMPMVLAGVLWIFQKRYLGGFILTSLAMALEIYANHPQITYYLGFCLLILGIVECIEAIKQKNIVLFLKQSTIILVAITIGIAINATRLLSMKQYADFSTRGNSELTITPDGNKKEITLGLNKEYITEYSYGKLETFNLFIPRFMGGGTVENLGKESHSYQFLKDKIGAKKATGFSEQVLTYWGEQPIVEAPAYIGAVLFFLFFLGLFLCKGTVKKWLVAATVFSILMSWGKNLEFLTHFFIDNFPLYNKFRAVSSIQVIAELCVPVLAILALKDFFSAEVASINKKEALKKAFYVMGGITLFFAIFGTQLFAFEGIRDESYAGLEGLIDVVISDRKSMFFSDCVRSFIFISLAAGLLWLLLKKKLKQTPVILAFTILILVDLISIDKRYVNEEDFKIARKIEKPFLASAADKLIMKDKSHYRVANFTVNPMQDGRTSYFHQSIGGYHAAKMRRYQELFDYQIAKNNKEVLNMLNTKYFIFNDANGKEQVQKNDEANGNAWFVEELKVVNSANQEIKALDNLPTKTKAVLNINEFKGTFKSDKIFSFEKDTTATIQLVNYDLTTVTYKAKTEKEQVAVFSEIYYKDGWNAYIDGELKNHFRLNYVLRGMVIPPGNHTIVFKFEPKIIEQGNTITLSAYALLFLIPLGWFFIEKRKNV